ncbi:MAG: iron-containing alcohol dehydrogenase [Lachnospiraceae bacterium]|nr:iron-containing alcohol dehydrogenase [Lachnospiraceae bacterium]
MKPFKIEPAILEFEKFAEYAKASSLGASDLILTNEYIYHPIVSDLDLGCQTIFQEKYGMGEPSDVMVDAILEDLSKTSFDRIIAIGGGTIIDIAKILAVAGSGDTVDDLYDRMTEGLEKVHPLTIIPTTCGTGSEVTNIAVVNRTKKGVKQGLVSPSMFADEAVLVPEMLLSLPYKVFATSSIDAMIHAVESFLSPNGCATSEAFSKNALELILSSWGKTAKGAEEQDVQAWKKYAAEFLRASNWAGIAFGYAGCAAVHALSYPLGGTHHIPHGQSNQLMFAAVMEKYKEKKPIGKINDLEALLGRILGVKDEYALETLVSLMDTILERAPLREHGMTEDEITVFAKNVIETQQRLLNNNYVELSEEEIADIYRNAF